MGLPNAWRSAAYVAATSSAACAMPSACAAMPMRPPSSVCMAILKPSPGSPSIAALGTAQSSKMRFAVDDPRIPSLSSGAPTEKPGASRSTRNAEMPLCFRDLSVVAKTTAASASRALVIQALVPFKTKWSPLSTAVVDAAPASEPFPGSERPKHPSFPPAANGAKNSAHCAASPRAATGAQYSELLTDMMTPADAQPREISSSATAYDTASMPPPPNPSSTIMPMKPSSPSSLISSAG
mmetsp:Transcript_1151/g.3226  ORF Transcript_1151/g.3226 Transcript_1151/m.3226 type:complete len:239 (+) Transcript_1151:88-804(+)